MHVLKIIAVVAALVAGLAAAPAIADVAASGTFTANAACPALQSIRKGTNPGNVMLTPQQGYQVVSANKTPPTHYFLVVPGATPDHRWAAVTCGTLSGGTARGGSTTPTTGGGNGKGDPWRSTDPTPTDQYVLALSWEPDFCVGRTDPGKPDLYKKECAAESKASWDTSHLALHGLWRDPYDGPTGYDICLEPQATFQALEKKHDWEHEPAVTLSTDVAAELATDMPGVQSDLQQHEWLVHGTCSGLGQDPFFSRATALADAINATAVRDYVATAAQTQGAVALDQVRDKIAAAFPGAVPENIVMTCYKDGSLEEIDIGMMGDVTNPAVSLATLLVQKHIPDEPYECSSATPGLPSH